jgi:ATP-dependent exoDNAse (exonuclease V) alpha subunit
MARADAARTLGADLAQLDRALVGRAHDAQNAQDARTRTGVREDQAAAALSVLTDGRRVSVINAPAGSGKTHLLAAIGQAWEAAGLGRVVGITPSQSARNTLAAGVPESYNTAQFLGHLPGQRGARGPVRLRPGDLVLIKEASMVSNPDLADVISHAAASGAKVDPGGGYPAVAGGGKRRRHVPARRRARLRPAHRAAPVPSSLGTSRQPAPALGRHDRAG